MSTPLKDRMRADAAAYTPLAALLGSSPFRWYDTRLEQGSSFPAVVVQQISGSKTYANSGRMPTGWSRYQFTIWGGYAAFGVAQKEAVAAALYDFMDQWDGGTGIAGNTQYPNQGVSERETLFSSGKEPVYQKQIDFMIFSNDSI